MPGPIVEAVSKEDLLAATQVTLRQSRLQSALGVEIDAEAVDEAMARLDFLVHAREKQQQALSGKCCRHRIGLI